MSRQAKGLAALTLGAIGVVYGDIGTSPLYTVKEILVNQPVSRSRRPIFWALSRQFFGR